MIYDYWSKPWGSKDDKTPNSGETPTTPSSGGTDGDSSGSRWVQGSDVQQGIEMIVRATRMDIRAMRLRKQAAKLEKRARKLREKARPLTGYEASVMDRYLHALSPIDTPFTQMFRPPTRVEWGLSPIVDDLPTDDGTPAPADEEAPVDESLLKSIVRYLIS